MPNLAQKFKLWRYVTAAEDAVPTTVAPSALADPRGEHGSDGVISTQGMSDNIMAMAFGTDAENETFSLHVVGWAENGPGVHLLKAAGILGASNFTESFLPDNGSIPTTTKFYTVDTWTLTANLIAATAPGTAAEQLTGLIGLYLKIPVQGFSHLRLYITDIRGGGVEAATVGVIWKPMDVARGVR